MRAGTATRRCWSLPSRGPRPNAYPEDQGGRSAAIPYSQPGDYLVWPGPNSNSFIAYVLAAIPEAGIVLPPTAIGKDWRVD